jgi:hypothetical protein
MIVDILFAAVTVMVGIATAMFFYGAGFIRGYDNGRHHERKVLNFFQRRTTHARHDLN